MLDPNKIRLPRMRYAIVTARPRMGALYPKQAYEGESPTLTEAHEKIDGWIRARYPHRRDAYEVIDLWNDAGEWIRERDVTLYWVGA